MATKAYERVLDRRQSDRSSIAPTERPHNPQNPQNAETVISDDVALARRLNTMLWRKLIYSGPHPEHSAFELSCMLRPTLEKLEDVADRITPKNPEGYDDPGDPFSCDAVAIWRLQVYAVERATPTPI